MPEPSPEPAVEILFLPRLKRDPDILNFRGLVEGNLKDPAGTKSKCPPFSLVVDVVSRWRNRNRIRMHILRDGLPVIPVMRLGPFNPAADRRRMTWRVRFVAFRSRITVDRNDGADGKPRSLMPEPQRGILRKTGLRISTAFVRRPTRFQHASRQDTAREQSPKTRVRGVG